MCFFFFNDTATTEIYTLSLHDALPIFSVTLLLKSLIIWPEKCSENERQSEKARLTSAISFLQGPGCLLIQVSNQAQRSEEHTSELQSRQYLVCRLLLEKKKMCLRESF